MKKVLLIGSGAREHAIAVALKNSKEEVELLTYGSTNNPGLQKLSAVYKVGDLKSNTAMVSFATQHQVDFAIVGPELPLAEGIVGVLEQVGIKSVGPNKKLAQIETSKSFARELMQEYKINGLPEFMAFENMEGVEDFIQHLEENFVIKPDGLTGGKGVKVAGDHFTNLNEALAIIEDFFANGYKIVLEEKFIGQEFSLMTLCDGQTFVHLPAVQDHKRALAGDQGPNTGGMGSYSMADHSLPFLEAEDIERAQKTNEAVAIALKKKFGTGYKGVLYGGFMATKDGVKLIEYNARFGDPEAMNLLTLMPKKTFPENQAADFLEICLAIIEGSLDKLKFEFRPVATVCKYVVPDGYPSQAVKNQKIDLNQIDESKVKIYYASVEEQEDGLYLLGSRALALVAEAKDIYEAEKIVETEINKISGPVFHREDIGTMDLIDRKVEMMRKLRG